MIYEQSRHLLLTLTEAARIDATINVILKPESATVQEVIHEGSAHADIVLLGLRGNEPGEEQDYAERMTSMLDGLPTVLFVRNAGVFRGQLLGDTVEEHRGHIV
jgi:hypothetical protein